MRELSDLSCRHQAQAYIARASRGPARLHGFEEWAASKDLAPEDRAEIQRQVAAILTRGDW